MNTITVSKSRIAKEEGVVILPVKKYEELVARAVPTYYLTGKRAEEADALVNEGIREYRSGKTIKASSIREALRIYGKNRARYIS
ncbi:MAG: hypothetical protein HYV67_01255 [Candidatus Taylorbacteria bacterium]|nr:hypothetical protein [Candidatus Taylorbacteria bacterium]